MAKTALCVGINAYAPGPGSPNTLRGCVNDALLIAQMLRGVAGFEVRILQDNAATKTAILEGLQTAVTGLKPGDYFVYWNSSHGYQVTDSDGDELADHRDEAACTYDTNPRDPLKDDNFRNILGDANPEATIFFGSDSCHSGTLTRLLQDVLTEEDDQAYHQPRLWIPPDDVRFNSGQVIDLGAFVGQRDVTPYVAASDRSESSNQRLISAARAAATQPQGTRARGMGPDVGAIDSPAAARDFLAGMIREGQPAARGLEEGRPVARGLEEPRLPAQVEAPRPQGDLRQLGQLGAHDEEQMNHVLLSGCLPEEVSWDANFKQGFHGAMTFNFTKAVLNAWLNDHRAITYEEAWQTAQQGITSGTQPDGTREQSFNQHPQLEGPSRLKQSPVFGYTP